MVDKNDQPIKPPLLSHLQLVQSPSPAHHYLLNYSISIIWDKGIPAIKITPLQNNQGTYKSMFKNILPSKLLNHRIETPKGNRGIGTPRR